MKAHKDLITYLSVKLWKISPKEVEDVLEGYNGIVFAENPDMVIPITEEKKAVNYDGVKYRHISWSKSESRVLYRTKDGDYKICGLRKLSSPTYSQETVKESFATGIWIRLN